MISSICFVREDTAAESALIVNVCFIRLTTEEVTPSSSPTSFSIFAEQFGQSRPFSVYDFVTCGLFCSIISTSGSWLCTISSICFVREDITAESALIVNVCFIRLITEEVTPSSSPTSFSIFAEQFGQSSPLSK